MNITDLKPGQKGTIFDINMDDKNKKKLMELGVTPGTSVIFVRKAPLGDPINIKVRGFNLALRKDLATKIKLEGIR
ncbi:MAG: ferrous iron transport protein A [Eubacteriaceae bacterium]|nr:ferrous iron transport protein A [Eubacteriaceae bacterium]